MRTRSVATVRLALIVLLLTAVVCAQAASLEEFHQESAHHCCGLCHAGMPFVRTAPVGPIAPIASNGWVERAWTAAAPREVLLTAGSSRAPPAASPVR